MHMPEILHPLGGLVLQLQVLGQLSDGCDGFRNGPGFFQPGSQAVIGQLGLVMHPGPVQAGAFHRSIRIDQHLDDNGQAVFIKIQGCDIGGYFFR